MTDINPDLAKLKTRGAFDSSTSDKMLARKQASCRGGGPALSRLADAILLGASSLKFRVLA